MKLFFKNAEHLAGGIAAVAEELGFAPVSTGGDVTVTVTEREEDGFSLSLDGADAAIVYGGGKARFFRALATMADWLRSGIKKKRETSSPLFKTNGAMIDTSRNPVPTVKTVKYMLRKMALMGMNTYMLYTEDTYEIDGLPYFGHLRGRYTKAELKELDAYAAMLGIELIPCIQVLGHLATYLKHPAATAHRDTPNCLLVGAEETYRLIDDMLRTISECFTTRRLHIGMDETHDLGTGASFDKNGYRERRELYFEHLRRVTDITKGYGFRPMMWSDMFFRMSADDIDNYEDYDMRVVLPENIGRFLPEGVQPVFWDYYHTNEEFYAINLEKHRLLSDETLFAGGVWLWSGICPQLHRSLGNTIPALDACRKAGTKEVLATVWMNGGDSAGVILALAGLAWYADYDYRGFYSEEGVASCFAAACRMPYADAMLAELPAYPHRSGSVGVDRALLYSDPLLGIADKHIEGLGTRTYYAKTAILLADKGEGEFAPAFEVVRRLCAVLTLKADLGVRLREAYLRRDEETLAALLLDCREIGRRLRGLWEAHRAAWMRYNKPFGWEICDLRYGGLMARMESAAARVEDYLAGRIARIEELEEPRLRMDGSEDAAPRFLDQFSWAPPYHYATNGTI